MTALLDTVWANLTAVNKATLKALVARAPIRFASIAALQAEETGDIESVEIAGQRFDADFADNSTADDGVDTLVTADSVRFVRRTTLHAAPKGAATGAHVVEEEVTLSGATTDATAQFPAGCQRLGVSWRVTETVTGATTFDIGDGSTADLYGDDVALTAGTTGAGMLDAAALAAAGTISMTANGSNFTGGKVRVALHYLTISAPAS